MTAADPMPVAQQARSRRTQERILAASFDTIAAGGIEALTVNAIAERAGVAVGSVYRRFGDKERLLLAVQSAFADQVRDDVNRRLTESSAAGDTSPAALVGHAVRSLVRSFQQHESLLRVFLLLGTHNPAVMEAGSRASVDSKRAFEAYLAGVDVRPPDAAAGLDFAFRLLYAALAHRVTQGEYLESDRPLSWDELELHLVDAVSRYLLAGQ